MTLKTLKTTALIAGLALSSNLAFALDRTVFANGKSIFGAPAELASATQVVDLAQAEDINIVCGETVAFRNGTQSFAWKFDVAGHRTVDLQAIAPAGFATAAAKPLKIYVERNELERN